MRAETAGDAGYWCQQAIQGRSYTGSAGKVTTCQIGVYAAYVSTGGHAFIERALFLPKSWTADPSPLETAHIPWNTAFASKPALAVEMIKPAIMTDMPFLWVTANAVYGVSDIEQALPHAGKRYALGIKADHRFISWSYKPVVARSAIQIASHPDPGA